MGLSAIAFLLGFVCLLPAALADEQYNEFYSWIDSSSGRMVITDDSGRIPPSLKRGPVQVHRFKESPSSPLFSEPDEPIYQMDGRPADEEDDASPSWQAPDRRFTVSSFLQAPDSMNPVYIHVPGLGGREIPSGMNYVWVPLRSPIALGNVSVAGFWWHPTAMSPERAFEQFLIDYRRQRGG